MRAIDKILMFCYNVLSSSADECTFRSCLEQTLTKNEEAMLALFVAIVTSGATIVTLSVTRSFFVGIIAGVVSGVVAVMLVILISLALDICRKVTTGTPTP